MFFMIKHYFKIAVRNLGRQKVLSFINISGLSIGLACFSLFLLYSINEFSFDRFHKNAPNIYRVYRWSEAMNGQEEGGDVYMPSPLGPAMKADMPDVAEYVRLSEGWGESFVKVDEVVRRMNVSYADPSIALQAIKGAVANPVKEFEDRIKIKNSKVKSKK